MEKAAGSQAIKKELFEKCVAHQQQMVSNAKEAMLHAQESANEEPGSMGDKFESFREQLHLDRDMFAKQLKEAMSGFAILKQLHVEKTYDQVQAGCVVVTQNQTYFIAISIGALKVKGQQVFVISTQSPLYLVMAGKKKNETFVFRDQTNTIIDVY